MLERIAPAPITSILGEALNMRTGTKGLSLPEVMNVAID